MARNPHGDCEDELVRAVRALSRMREVAESDDPVDVRQERADTIAQGLWAISDLWDRKVDATALALSRRNEWIALRTLQLLVQRGVIRDL